MAKQTGPEVDFYYGLASRYSYLASTQLAAIEDQTGCRFVWHPIKSVDFICMYGRDPFDGSEPSGQYAWDYRRYDAECWASFYGVAYSEPENFKTDPIHLVLAAIAAKRLGAVEAFSRRLFQAVFVDGVAVEEPDLMRFAADIGLNSEAFAAFIADPQTEALHRKSLDEANAQGAFGVPTFFVGERMFWGNDRLLLLKNYLLPPLTPAET